MPSRSFDLAPPREPRPQPDHPATQRRPRTPPLTNHRPYQSGPRSALARRMCGLRPRWTTLCSQALSAKASSHFHNWLVPARTMVGARKSRGGRRRRSQRPRRARSCSRPSGGTMLVVPPVALPPQAVAPAPPARVVAGRSVEGRRIVARRLGDASAPLVVLAVGPVHGDEPGARAPIAALRSLPVPAGMQVWTVALPNPDGLARGTRQNARGVDLNRNFPERWRAAGRRGDRFWGGPAAGSEPETAALRWLVCRAAARPDGLVPPALRHRRALSRRRPRRAGRVRPGLRAARARAAGLPRHGRRLADAGAPGSGLLVELPAGLVSPAAARRHAQAVLATAHVIPPTRGNSRRSCGH